MDSVNGQTPATSARTNNRKFGKRKLALLGTGILIALAVIVLSGLFLYRSSTAATIDSGKYQAVFFTNGQVYFGKLAQVNSSYFKLTDVFYIQASDTNAETDTESKNPQETATGSTDIRLIKLGSEVHGPDDAMVISKDQVLFFENLKKDGKVTDSIIKFNQQRQ
ncbi:MAG: hypothetical protein ABIR46_00720 [Candidatus Saccharimonadales bacterium]